MKVPHILFVLADDYGWNDIGYHANHSAQGYYNGANPSGEQTTNPAAGMMRTPTLDMLAAEGVKLESYYVQPLCSPTRSTIMTGRYASHTGIGPDVLVENVPFGVPGREVFIGEYLKKAGYKTHAVGKVSADDRQAGPVQPT
jgi:arylsulfatase B/arylsulfatase I/J